MTFPLDTLLRDPSASAGRAKRRAAYRAAPLDLVDLTHVVHVEKCDGTFAELDAESHAHAEVLAMNVVRHWTAVNSVAVRRVMEDGSLSRVLRTYDFRDVEEA